MLISRRNFLGASAAAVVAAHPPLAWNLEPPRSAQPAGPIILNSNENAYGAFPSVMREIERSGRLANRYPDDHRAELLRSLAAHHRCSTDNLVLGCGSTDILRMVAEALCAHSRVLVQAAPTFEALAMYAGRGNATVRVVPLRADYSHDVDGIIEKLTPAPDAVYICNPNNPTGSLTPPSEIERLVSKLPKDTYVLIDEAYHHFAEGAAGYKSFIQSSVSDPRVIVARTFSKIYGLAGLRIGYAVAGASTVRKLARFRVFDSPNVVATRAAIAALRDPDALAAAVLRNAADREEFLHQAASRTLKVVPPHTNFVMFDTGRPVREIRDAFRRKNILIGRPFPPYDTHARVSLGTPAEMRAFWSAWDSMSIKL